MQYKKLLLLGICCALSIFAYSQNTAVSGHITDTEGNPIVGATILLQEISKGGSSDSKGNFSIKNLSPGTYTVEVRYIGYSPKIKKVNLKRNQTLRLDFQLSESAYGLEAVTISAKSKAKITKELAYNVDVIDTKQLQNSTLDIGHALDRVSGVRIRESGGVGSRMSFSLNGFTGKQLNFLSMESPWKILDLPFNSIISP